MIKALARIIVALNTNVRKEHIAAGIAWGLLLGCIPAGNLLWILLFLFSLILVHNHAAKLLVLGLVKLALPLLAPLTDAVGWAVLTHPALVPVWTSLYNFPLAPLLRFNHTLVMGGLTLGTVLWPAVFFLSRFLVARYRTHVAQRLVQSRWYKALLRIPFVARIKEAIEKTSRILHLVH